MACLHLFLCHRDGHVFGAAMQVLNGSFKEEVVQLGGHLRSRNVYSPV